MTSGPPHLLGDQLLAAQILAELRAGLLQFRQREFRILPASGDLCVEIAAHDAARDHRHHDPVSHAREPAELECRMQRHEERRRQSHTM